MHKTSDNTNEGRQIDVADHHTPRFPGIPGWLALICWLLLTWNTGCRKSVSGSNSPEAGQRLVLADIIEHYRSAPFYQDQARIILQYSLNGVPFEEIHPWSSCLDRNDGQRFLRFRMEIHCRPNRGSLARVLDPSTQNLGGQVLCAQRSGQDFVNRLMKDRIGQHFLFGRDDIPWNESLAPEKIDEILSVIPGLFQQDVPTWFSESAIEKSDTVMVDGVAFADAVFKTPLGPVICRFDLEKQALVGMRLPSTMLSSGISNSRAVTNITFAILVEEISFEQGRIPDLTIEKTEKPVTRFVKLPEAFPSPLIGKKLESWSLAGEDGKPFDPRAIAGTPCVLIYGSPNQFEPDEFKQIENISREHPYANIAWILPPGITDPQQFQFSRMGKFRDMQGKLLQATELSEPVFYLLADSNGIVQFLSKRKKNWLVDLPKTLSRIRQGDDIAREMHSEYARYFEAYQKALDEYRAPADLVEGIQSANQ